MSIEAMKQALEAMELHATQYPHMQKGYTVDAITALRTAIGAAEQAEPTQWVPMKAASPENQAVYASMAANYNKKAERAEPIARVTGYFNGQCVIEPLDPALVLTTGLALYGHAPAPQPPATIPDNSQEWSKLDGAQAWHLIERHADSWADVGKMMGEWLAAHQQRQQPLTDEWIKSMCKEAWTFETVKKWVCIVEAAHGIKERS